MDTGGGGVGEKHSKTKAKIRLFGRPGKGKTRYPPRVTFTDALIRQ